MLDYERQNNYERQKLMFQISNNPHFLLLVVVEKREGRFKIRKVVFI